MPGPQFQLSPGLLQQLASGGSFRPGQAMLQGLALGRENQQNALTNAFRERQIGVQEKQVGLSEKKYDLEIQKIKDELAEKAKIAQAKKRAFANIQTRTDLTEQQKQTYMDMAETTGMEKANEYLLSLDDQQEELDTYELKKQIDARYQSGDQGDLVEVWSMKDGKPVREGTYFEGEIPKKYKGNPNYTMTRIGKPEGSMADIGIGAQSEQPANRDQHRQGLQDTSSQMTKISSALINWDSAQDASGMTGILEENVSGVIKQVFGDVATQAWRGLIGVNDPGAVVEYRQKFKALSARNVPEFTGELGSRISDKELEISDIASRVNDWKADAEQARVALESIVSIQAQIQEGHRLALGKGFRYDMSADEGRIQFIKDMKGRGIRKEPLIKFAMEMERWQKELGEAYAD